MANFIHPSEIDNVAFIACVYRALWLVAFFAQDATLSCLTDLELYYVRDH